MIVGAESAVASRSVNPALIMARPTLAATDTARSKLGAPWPPSASTLLSRKTVADERRAAPARRGMSAPALAPPGPGEGPRAAPGPHPRPRGDPGRRRGRGRTRGAPAP